MQERGVAVQGVDEVGEALEGDAVVFAVELLEGGVCFEDVGEGVRALEAEFLVCRRQSVGVDGVREGGRTFYEKDPQVAVPL